MTLRQDINDAMKTAMKEKDQVRLSTLRLVNAAIKDRDIAARSEDRCDGVTDEEILAVLTKMVKQRDESFKTYEEAGRLDLAEREQTESEIIKSFLPRQLSEDEIQQAVAGVVDELEADGLKDMGRCMGALKQRYAGSMDFGRAGALMKERLG
ncbi:MAG: GatB/YqeY domain-containing protein [Pseudomonadota bacterium]